MNNLALNNQLVGITSVLFVIYVFAFIPKTLQLLTHLLKTKSNFKKLLYGLFFILSVVADLVIMALAVQGIIFLIK